MWTIMTWKTWRCCLRLIPCNWMGLATRYYLFMGIGCLCALNTLASSKTHSANHILLNMSSLSIKITKQNWKAFVADEDRELSGHLMRYPVKLSRNGKLYVQHFRGRERGVEDKDNTEISSPTIISGNSPANPDAKGFNGKSFPYYDDWRVVFGKDRATGELAEDASGAGANMGREEVDSLFENCYVPEVMFGDNAPSEAGQQSTPTGNSSQRKGKKRSRLVAEEPLLNDAMVSFLKDSNETLSTIADSMGYSKEL